MSGPMNEQDTRAGYCKSTKIVSTYSRYDTIPSVQQTTDLRWDSFLLEMNLRVLDNALPRSDCDSRCMQ